MQYNIMTQRNNNRGWRHLFGREKRAQKLMVGILQKEKHK